MLIRTPYDRQTGAEAQERKVDNTKHEGSDWNNENKDHPGAMNTTGQDIQDGLEENEEEDEAITTQTTSTYGVDYS